MISPFRTSWPKDGDRLGALRREVFVVEQKVPEELEWDEHDAGAIHFACQNAEHEIVATARLILGADTATIGRLCVAAPYRHQKIATRLMDEMLTHCRALQVKTIELHAQLYLQEFYERYGFTAQGEIYLEAGIEHLTMQLSLQNGASGLRG